MRRRDILLASLAAPLATTTAGAEPTRRVAFVIGNSDYPTLPLPTPGHDATRIAARLRQLPFVVAQARNMERMPLQAAISATLDVLQPGDLALFYYSGHALQVKGRNYLVPLDFRADRMTGQSANSDMISVDRLLERTEPSQRRGVILLLDTCWPDSLARQAHLPGTGLAAMTPPPGTLVVFAAEPGTMGFYGDQPTSPLATAFLEALDMPGLPIEQLLEHLQRRVTEQTKGDQRIWVANALRESVVLVQPDS